MENESERRTNKSPENCFVATINVKITLSVKIFYTKAVFLKSAGFVSFTDKNFKCLTEILILSVRMSDAKIQDVIHRRLCNLYSSIYTIILTLYMNVKAC